MEGLPMQSEEMDTSTSERVSSVDDHSLSQNDQNVVTGSAAAHSINLPLDNPAAINAIAIARTNHVCFSRNEMVRRLHGHHQNIVCRPHLFADNEAERRYNESLARIARIQKMQIIEDSLAIEEYFGDCQRILANEALTYDQMAQRMEKKLDRLNFNSWLRCEQRLLQIDVQIKFSLTLAQADVDKCLFLLDELGATTIAPLMLKKHPSVVETIKKLRKYVGNVSQWKLTAEEKSSFETKASLIRMKAVQIYDNLKVLFGIPTDKLFWPAFTKIVDEFRIAIEGLRLSQIRNMTEDPTIQPRPPKRRVVMDGELAASASESGSTSDINLPSDTNTMPDVGSAPGASGVLAAN